MISINDLFGQIEDFRRDFRVEKNEKILCRGTCKMYHDKKNLVNGICIFEEPEGISELTHMKCSFCDEWKRDFEEREFKTPYGKNLVEICADCAGNFDSDPEFGWKDNF